MENAQVAKIFEEIADLIELQEGNAFRIRAYRSAAQSINNLSQRLEDMVAEGQDLSKIPHVGGSTAEKVHEILETGTCKRLEELREETPEELAEVMQIPGLGPRKAMQLHQALNVKSIDDVKKACEQHKVRGLEGMGAKTEEKILKGIQTLATASGRFLYNEARDHVESIGRHLDGIEGIDQWEVAGSFRRGKETIGDLDILIQAKNRKKVADEILGHPEIDEIIGHGEEKVSIRLGSGLQIDFRFFDPEAFGAALMYFTGSKAHNIALRKRAAANHWKLNEYGLFKDDTLLAGKTEEAVYKKFKFPWIPPELREDRGEFEAADEDRLPDLIKADDLRGDLHSHTKATDGANTIEEMAQAAQDRGYKFLAVTDHSKAVRVARGLDAKRLKKHAEDVRQVASSLKNFWLLAGIEVDILKTGKLDLPEKVLAGLDWVVASIHYYHDLDEKAMTDRLVAAAKSGVVHCLGHPCARIIGKRDPIQFDVDKVFAACKENNVAVEINAQPTRQDLPDTFCQRAKEAGLKFTIDTDAHKDTDLDFMYLGVNVARRGWLEKKDVLNTLTPNQLKKRLQRT